MTDSESLKENEEVEKKDVQNEQLIKESNHGKDENAQDVQKLSSKTNDQASRKSIKQSTQSVNKLSSKISRETSSNIIIGSTQNDKKSLRKTAEEQSESKINKTKSSTQDTKDSIQKLSKIDENTNEPKEKLKDAKLDENTKEPNEKLKNANLDGITNEPEDKLKDEPIDEQTDQHDVERILKDLMKTTTAQAVEASEKLDRVFRKYNEATCLPVLRQQAAAHRLATLEAVEEADCIIGELVEAIYVKEEQRRRFAQGTMDTLQTMMEEEKKNMHRSTAMCMEALRRELDKALALIDQSNASRNDLQAHSQFVEKANFERLESQYHSMLAWTKATQHALRAKYRDHKQLLEEEDAESRLASSADYEDILRSLVSLHHFTEQLKHLSEVETQHQRALVDTKLQEDAIRAEIARLKRRLAAEERTVEYFETHKRQMLEEEKELRAGQRSKRVTDGMACMRELTQCKREFWDQLIAIDELCDAVEYFYSKVEKCDG